MPGLTDEDVVYVSAKNKLLEVPYFVVADHEHKKIVVAIRGTLSLEDTLTDLCAMPESMESLGLNPDFKAHSGMIKTAKYVYDELRHSAQVSPRKVKQI